MQFHMHATDHMNEKKVKFIFLWFLEELNLNCIICLYNVPGVPFAAHGCFASRELH